MAAKKKSDSPKSPRAPARRKTPKKQAAGSAGLQATEVALDAAPKDLADRVAEEGGAVVGAYRDPLGGHPARVLLPSDLFGAYCRRGTLPGLAVDDTFREIRVLLNCATNPPDAG